MRGARPFQFRRSKLLLVRVVGDSHHQAAAHLDRIVVFEDGQVVEDGSHAELLERNGQYAHMWGMQAGGFLPERKDGEENIEPTVIA